MAAVVSMAEQSAQGRNPTRFDKAEVGSNNSAQSTDSTVSVCTVALQDGPSSVQNCRFALSRMRDTEGTVSLQSVFAIPGGVIHRIQTW